VALALLAILRLMIIHSTHEFILTNKRIVIKTGLLSRHTFEVLLTKVEAIGVSQSLFGRILGYGDILITGTGGAKSLLGTNNLVGGNYTLNIPCYFDTGADTTAVTIQNWTLVPQTTSESTHLPTSQPNAI
jgi:hypothetical protein